MLARTRPFALALAVALALVTLLTPRAPSAGTWAHDPTVNTPIQVAPQGDCVSGFVTDGKNGGIVAVANPCSLITVLPAHFPEEGERLYHLRRNDGIDPAWPAGGVLMPFTSNLGVNLIADGTGGVILGWGDTRNLAVTGRDVYALHVRANGTLDPAWAPTGVPLCTATGGQLTPRGCSDGSGGAFFAWSDRRDSLTALNASDIYATHVLANGTVDPAFPANGRAVYVGAANQTLQATLEDGAHGAYVVWSERRNVATNHGDVYVAHLLANGTLDPAWPVGGLGVAATTTDENFDGDMSDGAGGYYVSWEDFNGGQVGVDHFLPNGTLDPGWPVGGAVVSDPSEYGYATALMPDGAGGLLTLWTVALDEFGLQNRIEARHVLANGTLDASWGPSPRVFAPTPDFRYLEYLSEPLPDSTGGGIVTWYDQGPATPGAFTLRLRGDLTPATGWTPTGLPIATAPGSRATPFPVPSGLGAAMFVFDDLRDSLVTDMDVYAQRVSERGRLGVDEPIVASVKDVTADQGGQAMVRWYWSSYDTLPTDPVTAYDVWRQLDGASLTAQQRAAAVPATAIKDPAPGAVRMTADGALDAYWEFVGSTPARGTSSYALAVATHGDSTSAGPAYETYEIDAHVAPANEIMSSPPDSGYSVDNLAPATPTGFAGAYATGTASLHWDPVIAGDLAGYRLYRGVPSTFTPSIANRIATPTTTNYTDLAGATYYYKLTAADVHGNESAPSTLLPTGVLTGVDDTVGVALAFGRPTPDPAIERTRLAYALPRAERVRLAVYDLAGRLVRRLADGVEPAGVHGRDWDLADDRGARVRAGMYFARFEAEGRRFERRVIVAR